MSYPNVGSDLAVGGLRIADDSALLGARAGSISTPLSTERLQAEVDRSGVSGIAVWGSGPVGAVRFEPPIPADAALRILPNRVEFSWPTGSVAVTALPTSPVIVFECQGDAPALRLSPGRKASPGFSHSPRLSRRANGWRSASDWSCTELGAIEAIVGARGSLRASSAWLAAGADEAEVDAAVSALLERGVPDALESHHAYLERVTGVFTSDDVELNELFVACLHAALACYKRLPGASKGAFAAGVGYSVPPRTYFRDSYWTVQALLPLWPELALEQLEALAPGVHDDGEAPSGVMLFSPAGERAWQARVAADPELAASHTREGEWWPDHFDSPYYFVLMARDVARWTGTPDLADRLVGGRRLGDLIRAVLGRSAAAAAPGALPPKPPHDRDWADNVFRGGHVTYDIGLYYGALLAAAELLAATAPREAAGYLETASRVRAEAGASLYRSDLGHFVEFVTQEGGGESHLTLDTLTALRFGLATPDQATSTLGSVQRILETRNNLAQGHGDWGVMCAYPPYRRSTKLRAKSAFPLRYHNGSDWPYLDGLYAEQSLAAGSRGWRYPLTRWRQYSLARGWPTPVEYYAPPWGRGSALNGWSAMPAAAMLLGGFGLDPRSADVKAPPWGDCELRGVLLGGGLSDVSVRGGSVSVAPT